MKPDWRWHIIQYKFQERKIVDIFELFRKHQIEPVLIKGWAAARNYPRKEERVFLDTDICVAPEDYKRSQEILEEIEGQNISVDLHNGLRHLDTLEWEDLFDNTEVAEIGTAKIRVLRPEDHLRVLCVHWLNDGGAYKERLRDILYAVENRPVDFDWDRCLNAVDQKRKKWILCAIGLAHRYLGLNLENTPASDADESIPNWVIETVEKEWADDVHLKRLSVSIWNGRELFAQLRKRFPPNPIQATVEVNGEFDEKSRIFYQFKNIIIRTKPSIQRFVESFLSKK